MNPMGFFSQDKGKMMGLFFPKLGNISIHNSQFWEIKGIRNPCLGKRVV